MRKGFLKYEKMRKYFPIYEEAVSHLWLCNCSILNFLMYEENLIFFFFISACWAFIFAKEHSMLRCQFLGHKFCSLESNLRDTSPLTWFCLERDHFLEPRFSRRTWSSVRPGFSSSLPASWFVSKLSMPLTLRCFLLRDSSFRYILSFLFLHSSQRSDTGFFYFCFFQFHMDMWKVWVEFKCGRNFVLFKVFTVLVLKVDGNEKRGGSGRS